MKSTELPAVFTEIKHTAYAGNMTGTPILAKAAVSLHHVPGAQEGRPLREPSSEHRGARGHLGRQQGRLLTRAAGTWTIQNLKAVPRVHLPPKQESSGVRKGKRMWS